MSRRSSARSTSCSERSIDRRCRRSRARARRRRRLIRTGRSRGAADRAAVPLRHFSRERRIPARGALAASLLLTIKLVFPTLGNGEAPALLSTARAQDRGQRIRLALPPSSHRGAGAAPRRGPGRCGAVGCGFGRNDLPAGDPRRRRPRSCARRREPLPLLPDRLRGCGSCPAHDRRPRASIDAARGARARPGAAGACRRRGLAKLLVLPRAAERLTLRPSPAPRRP
jgi:hypothetical protein